MTKQLAEIKNIIGPYLEKASQKIKDLVRLKKEPMDPNAPGTQELQNKLLHKIKKHSAGISKAKQRPLPFYKAISNMTLNKKETYLLNQYKDKLLTALQADHYAMQHLQQRFKSEEGIMEILRSIDPTEDKGQSYLHFITRAYANREFTLEKVGEVKKELEHFDKVKTQLAVKDIDSYRGLQQMRDASREKIPQISKKELKRTIKAAGSEVLVDTPTLKIIKIKDYEACKFYVAGTKWCLSKKGHFSHYQNEYPGGLELYLIVRRPHGSQTAEKIGVHPDSGQFMDMGNRHIRGEHLEEILNEKGMDVIIQALSKTPQRAKGIAELLGNGRRAPTPLEAAIAKRGDYSYQYAIRNLEGKRFELGEPEIAKSRWALNYAREILKGRFREAEPYIFSDALSSETQLKYMAEFLKPNEIPQFVREFYMQTPDRAYIFARNVIKGPWPEAEHIIANDARASLQYAVNLLGGHRFPRAEPLISLNLELGDLYAQHIIKGRWKEFEDTLLQSGDEYYINNYINHVIKGPWPEAEHKLIMYSDYAINYAKNHLKGRFPAYEQHLLTLNNDKLKARAISNYTNELGIRIPEFEPILVTQPDLAINYMENHIQGRWPELEKVLFANHDYDKGMVFNYFARAMPGQKWPEEVEKIISKEPYYSLSYAKEHLKAPFPAGEEIISKNLEYAYDYTKNVLKKRSPEFEKKLLAAEDNDGYRDLNMLLNYARDVVEGPWKAAEPFFAKNKDIAYDYAYEVLKKRFPAGEAVIAKDGYLAFNYAKNVLKARFPKGEPAIQAAGYLNRYMKELGIRSPIDIKQKPVRFKYNPNR